MKETKLNKRDVNVRSRVKYITVPTITIHELAFTYGHCDAEGFIEGELLGSVEVDGLPLGCELGIVEREG